MKNINTWNKLVEYFSLNAEQENTLMNLVDKADGNTLDLIYWIILMNMSETQKLGLIEYYTLNRLQ